MSKRTMSFSDVLKYLEYYVSKDLVSSEKYDDLCCFFLHFPGDMTNEFGFESVMNDPYPIADFSMKIRRKKITELFKIRDENICSLTKIIGINKDFKSIWLEFDNRKKSGVPGIFFETSDSMNVQDIISISNKFNRNQDEIFFSYFLNEYKSIIKYIGYFMGRNPSTVRFCLELNDKSKLIEFVKQHYMHNFIDSRLIRNLLEITENYIINVDIDRILIPKLSIEFSHDVISAGNQTRWNSFLDVLSENNLCDIKKCNALKNWYGESREFFNPVLCKYYTYRIINHFKISSQSENKLTVKVYYGFSNIMIK